MKIDDVELIQRILAGDETAFAKLIRKYERQVHMHALGKIGDFHIAEDIMQETFLQVYQHLETLNDPMQFSRWIYAIVNNLCIAWHRKDRLQTEPLEGTHISEIETEAYSRYVATEQAKTSAESQRDLVKKLLAKLKDRDRQVITLHYFEEMTSSEIGTHLGVSENTIKSRLHRARQRLKKYEFMIQEALDITIEGGHRSEKQLKGETIMTDETRDEPYTASLEEMQRQIVDLQEQLRVIADESDAFLNAEKREAMSTLCRFPIMLRVQSRGVMGEPIGLRVKNSKRFSLWTDSIDNFISRTSDAAIANLAGIFANPTSLF